MKKLVYAGLAVASFAAIAVAMGGDHSGLKAGESIVPFHPKHIAGALKGSSDCFPCTYQARPQVQAWISGDSHENIVKLAQTLDNAMGSYEGKEFKALLIILTDKGNEAKITEMVKTVVKEKGLTRVSIALLDKGAEPVTDYKINLAPKVKNTVLVYKDWKVTKNFVNLKADDEGAKGLVAAIAEIAN